MRDKLASGAFVFALSLCVAPLAEARGTVKLVLGTESLDEDYWRPADEPFDVGVAITLPLTGTRLVAELGVLLLSDSASAFDPGSGLLVEVELSGMELFAGLGIEIAPRGKQYAFFTGGISQTDVELTVGVPGVGSVSADDTSFGVYVSLGGGMRSRAVDFTGGVRLRLNTEVSLFSVRGDVDGVALLVTLGYRF